LPIVVARRSWRTISYGNWIPKSNK
jgi:hypothetical protein